MDGSLVESCSAQQLKQVKEAEEGVEQHQDDDHVTGATMSLEFERELLTGLPLVTDHLPLAAQECEQAEREWAEEAVVMVGKQRPEAPRRESRRLRAP